MSVRIMRIFCLCCIFIFVHSYSVSAVSLDAQFGNDGRVAVELGVYGERANDVAVQPDGRIVVAGSSSNTSDYDFMILRLLPDGSLDPEFNFDGTVTTAVGSGDDEALALTLQDDGKILAVGYSSGESDRNFALVRYNSDGSLDRDFGEEGMVVTSVGNKDDEITGVVLQDDGSIVVTGSASGTVGRVLVLARYRADGTLDKEFADEGFSFTGVGEDVQAESVALLEDGRIVVSGSYFEGDHAGMMVVGYTSNGELDETFGDDGIAISANGAVQSEGYGMIVRQDGSLLVAGSVGADDSRDTALFQFTTDGKVDKEFADDGVLVTSVGPSDDVLYDVVETDKGLAGSGFAANGDVKEFLLITYEKSGVTVKNNLVRKEKQLDKDTPTWLRISELLVEDSFSELTEEKNLTGLKAEILTTTFTDNEDFATALAVRADSGLVAVGVMSSDDISHAGISSYRFEQTDAEKNEDPRAVRVGSDYILTGEPYDVTRTTAVIPVTVYSDIGSVTERGIVFSTYSNPTVEGVAANTKKKDDNPDKNPGDEPVLSGLAPSGKQINPVTLKVTTNVAANCKWSVTAGTEFSKMETTFKTTGGSAHSHTLDTLKEGSHTYYVRCQDAAGTVNTKDSIITFTVTRFFTLETQQFSHDMLVRPLQSIGDFFVSSALAAEGDGTGSAGADTGSTNVDSKPAESFFSAKKEEFLEKGVIKEGGGTGTFTSELENLKPGTFFYARAYAVVDGKTVYGNTVGFRTSDSCFIATAAFGSVFHPTVHLLRDFRDHFMITNPVGRLFVQQYYRFSPPLADLIASNAILMFITRMLLLPIIGLAWLALKLGALKSILVLAAGTGTVCYGFMPSLRLRRA